MKMLEEEKKEKAKLVRRNIILMVVLVCAILAISKFTIINYILGSKEIEKGVPLSNYEGKYVSCNVKYPLKDFAKKYKVSDTGIKKVDEVGYVTWNEEMEQFICVSVSQFKRDEMDTLVEKTWDYITDENAAEITESIQVKGTVTKMSSEQLEGYKEVMATLHEQDAVDEIGDTVYYIADEQIRGVDTSMMWTSIVIAAIVMLVFTIETLKNTVTFCKKNIKHLLEERPNITREMLEQDFESATPFKKHLWIGYNYTFAFMGDWEILVNEEITQAYMVEIGGKDEVRVRFESERKIIEVLLAEDCWQEALRLCESRCHFIE